MHYHRFNLTTVPGCERGEGIMSQHHHQFCFVFGLDKNSLVISDSEVSVDNLKRINPALRKALGVLTSLDPFLNLFLFEPPHFHPKISLSKMTQNSLKRILNTIKKLTF